MKNKKIVLITEDDLSLRSALFSKLSNEGFTVFEAKNGQEGLDIALQEHPDLIIIDILMPRMDGLTMLKKLREDDWGKSAHFIILTNVDNSNAVAEAIKSADIYNHGTFEYYIKTNIKLEEVVNKVKEKLSSK